MADFSKQWWSSLEQALAAGEGLARNTEEFDLVCRHVVQLLLDSSTLLAGGSHATAAFLAITAIEETAKAHIGMFRRSAVAISRSKDPLYKHGQKHQLALGPTVAMGTRLQAAVGASRMNELLELGRNRGLVALREAALYFEQAESTLKVPTDAVSRTIARELLLLAVEAFDDALVGTTNLSFELRRETDEIFARWAHA